MFFGCVETGAGRREIQKAVTDRYCRAGYWFDLGNNAASGQYLLGQPPNGRNRRRTTRLRTISARYPEIIDTAPGENPLASNSTIQAPDAPAPCINHILRR